MCLSPCSCKTVQCASYQGRLSSSNILILKGWTSCKSLQLTLTSDHKQRAIVLSNCILYWQSRNLSLTPPRVSQPRHLKPSGKRRWECERGKWANCRGKWLSTSFPMIFDCSACFLVFTHVFFVVSWVECGTARVKEEEEGSRGKCSLVPCSTVAQWHSSGAGAISKWDLCPSIEQRTDLPTLNRA